MLKIAYNQMNPTVGDFEKNVHEIILSCNEAVSSGADMLVFPELALSGYYPMDLLDEPSFVEDNAKALVFIIEQSKAFPNLTIVLGSIRPNDGVGKSLFNALVVIKDGELIVEYHKQLLPTYNIFDERRHFEPGQNRPCVINVKGYSIGMFVCEDGWNDDAKDYLVNPFDDLKIGVDLIISINASPSNIGKREQRHALMANACQRHGLPLLYVNCVGGQDSLVFDGASFAMDANGCLAFESDMFTSVMDIINFKDGRFLPIVADYQLSASLSVNEFYYRQIIMGLRDYTRRCGFQKVVIGSSGGIDSALTLALAVATLGADNVIAVTMPSEYSSTGSVSDSEALCANLGIKLYTHPIKALVDDYKAQYEISFAKPLMGLALENLQARIRGTILMEYSNDFGALVLTTGNKSEISVGYCTLYGDTNGGLGLIGDLYKTEIFQLSRYINERAGQEIIPMAIIEKAPSAELAPDQKDSDSLPDYEILDPMLKLLIEGNQLSPLEYSEAKQQITAFLSDNEGQAVYQKVKKMISRNEYKRRQAPPIIRVRSRSFGPGRQMPLTARY